MGPLRHPRAVPTALKVLRGNPGKRALPKSEPQRESLGAETVREKCPQHLNDQAKRWWLYYADMFCPSRIVTETDLPMLEMLAKSTAERIDMETKIEQTGPLVKSNNGYVQISPLFTLADRARDREFKLLREFGGSPTSRTAAQAVVEAQPSNPWADLKQA